VRIETADGAVPDTAFVRPVSATTMTFTEEGRYVVTYRAVDVLGNAEPEQTVEVRIDRTEPTITGLPDDGCRIWPPNHRFVKIADVTAADNGSGVAAVDVEAWSEDGAPEDVRVEDGEVWVSAELAPRGRNRTYTVTARAVDRAGNTATATGSCVVKPPDRPS
jgi:hypothetical protein